MKINPLNGAVSYTMDELKEVADDLENIVRDAKKNGAPDSALWAANVLRLLGVERNLKS